MKTFTKTLGTVTAHNYESEAACDEALKSRAFATRERSQESQGLPPAPLGQAGQYMTVVDLPDGGLGLEIRR